MAIEAHPRAVAEIEAMRELNHLTCVSLVHAALTDERGTATITDSPLGASNTIVDHGASGREVPASTLDEVFERLGIAEVDLLKSVSPTRPPPRAHLPLPYRRPR